MFPSPRLDATAAAPILALASDTGTDSADRITSNGTVNVSGLETGASWQYSTDNGNSWTDGSGTSFTLSGDGAKVVAVRQTDMAGTPAHQVPPSHSRSTPRPSHLPSRWPSIAAAMAPTRSPTRVPSTSPARIRRDLAVQHRRRQQLGQWQRHILRSERRRRQIGGRPPDRHRGQYEYAKRQP